MYHINRAILILRAKQPVVDWINECAEEDHHTLTIEEINSDPEVFLIPPIEKASDQKKILKILSPSIWVHVLDGWCTDEDLWPKNRTIKKFHEWFDLQFSSMPIDFVENEIERIDFNEPAIF